MSLFIILIINIIIIILFSIKYKTEKNFFEEIITCECEISLDDLIKNIKNVKDEYVKKVEKLENNLKKINDEYKNNLELQKNNTENIQNKQIQLENEILKISELQKNNTEKIQNKQIQLENKISIISYKYDEMLDLSFPIGSYFITSSSEFNPSQKFSGKWELIKDRFIISAGNKYKTNTIGGEEKHTLTYDEMPAHIHKSSWKGDVYQNHINKF